MGDDYSGEQAGEGEGSVIEHSSATGSLTTDLKEATFLARSMMKHWKILFFQ